MAASVAFLHQVEYEAALNEFEEEAKRQFELHQDEERAEGDETAKGEISRAQSPAVQRQKMQLRRRLLVRPGDAEKYDARKSTSVASWLSVQESAKNVSASAQDRWQSRGAGRSFGITRPSQWQDKQSRQRPQQNPNHCRRRQSILLITSAAMVADVHPRHSSSITSRTGIWHRILHLHAVIDGILPIFSPESFLRRVWDLVIMTLVIWTAVTVPLSVSFGLPDTPELQVAGYAVTAMYALDLFANFRTAYYNHQAELVRDSAAITTHYMKTWFWVDLFGTIPFDSIVLWTGALKDVHKGTSNAELAALGFLKAPRLLRLGRLLRFLDRFKNAKIFRIVQLFMAMILFSHWLACTWYMMYRFGGKDAVDDWAFEVAVFETPNASVHATSSYHANSQTADVSGTTLSMYVVTYYYSFLLLVGDNVTAYNNFERTFCVLVLIAGTFFYSAVVGQMATLVATMNVAVNRHGQKLLMVQDALRYAGVPDGHSEKVQKYYEYLQQRSHPGAEGMQFLQELPSSLHVSLCQFLHLRSLHKVPLFKDCEEGFMSALSLRIRMISLSPNEVIFRVGDVGKEMYVIKKGCVAVTSPTQTMWGLLQPGEIFGEVALLSTGKRTANCTALGFVDLAVLTGPDLKAVMRDYPVSASIIYERVAARAAALQSKSKMWLDIPADEEFYDCEEPNDDADGGGNRGDNAGNDDGGGDGGGGDRSGAAIHNPSGRIIASPEDGDAGSVVTRSSITSGSLTSSSIAENLIRGAARGIDSGSNIGGGDGGDDVDVDPMSVKNICIAAFGGCPEGDSATTKTVACTSGAACDDSGCSVGTNAAMSCSETLQAASTMPRTPSLTVAARPGGGVPRGMLAPFNGRVLCMAWCDIVNQDADAGAAPEPAAATAAVHYPLASHDNSTTILPAKIASLAESETRRQPLSEIGPPEKSTPPPSPPSDCCTSSPRPARFLTREMTPLPITSEPPASSPAGPQLKPAWGYPAPSPQAAGPAAAPATEGNASGGCSSPRVHTSLRPAQPLAVQTRIARSSPVNFATAAVTSVARGGPTSRSGSPFDVAHLHPDRAPGGGAAGLASDSAVAAPTPGTYRTANSRRGSSPSDDFMPPIDAAVSNEVALNENGGDRAAKLIAAKDADEGARQVPHQTHRMRQGKSKISVSGLAASGSGGAAAARATDITRSRSPGRSPQHNHQLAAQHLQRHHITADDGSGKDDEATPATATTPLEPFGLPLQTSNGLIDLVEGTSGSDANIAWRHPTSHSPLHREGSVCGSGGSIRVSDGASMCSDRQPPAVMTAACVDDCIRNSAEAAPVTTNGEATSHRSRAGPVAEAVDLSTPFTLSSAASASPSSQQAPNRSRNLSMLSGAANTATGGSADACASAAAPSATSPPNGSTRDAVRRRSSFLRWLQAGPAPNTVPVAAASGSAIACETAASDSASPATSVPNPVATLLHTNGAAILRLSRRAIGLLPHVGGPSGNHSSGGAVASAVGGMSLSQPPSASSRRTSCQSTGTGTIAPAPAEPVQVAEEELQWISTRPSYGTLCRGVKTRRSSFCSILEEELPALAQGPFGPRHHVPSSGPMSSSNRSNITDCRPEEDSTPKVCCSSDTNTGMSVGTSTGMDMGTSSGAGLASAAAAVANTGNRRGGPQLPHNTMSHPHCPESSTATGSAGNAIGMRGILPTCSGHVSRTPLPPAPPPDGVFVPRDSWEKLVQALTWFESSLQQLTDLATAQDAALSRLEQRAERAAALGGAGHGAVDDGILSGIIPASIFADAATSAAAAAGSGNGAVAAGVGGSTQTAAAMLSHSLSSTSYGRSIPASRAATPGGGASSVNSLSRSDSQDANTQRVAASRIRSAVRALTVSNRMRNSYGVGVARVSVTSTPAPQAPGIPDAATSSPTLSPSPLMAPLRSARASDTPDGFAGLMSFRGSGGSGDHQAATSDLSGGDNWAGAGVSTWDLDVLMGHGRRRRAGSASGLPIGTQIRQGYNTSLAAHGSGLRAALKGVASMPSPLQESPSLLKPPSGRLSSHQSSWTGNRRGGE
ncbi:hypothetical protein VaNZ11_003776 [Volvox africanus]|uniref:Cyclic nucleotide-binding domain-containing protein n=1 Tax=Volvox africanus TaxID=51714 RepID=A0ABQ5RVQ5_9CHLO|nr:hypothetical protein VaNZ11_003776 [Volvox africanus]